MSIATQLVDGTIQSFRARLASNKDMPDRPIKIGFGKLRPVRCSGLVDLLQRCSVLPFGQDQR
jgi:hypothetical protein